MVFSSSRVMIGIRIRIGFSVWLVSGYAHVFTVLSVVIAPYPLKVWTEKVRQRQLVTYQSASAVATKGNQTISQ